MFVNTFVLFLIEGTWFKYLSIETNHHDDVVVRASASQSVDLGSFPLSSHTKRL